MKYSYDHIFLINSTMFSLPVSTSQMKHSNMLRIFCLPRSISLQTSHLCLLTLCRLMAQKQVVQGQCGSCGKGNRVLMPPGQDGHYSCIVCALLTTIQQMTTRVDSESDHHIVRFDQDLQAAAQRFWSTPQTMNYHFSIVTAFDLSIHPTPIMPTTTASISHADTPTD